MEETSSSRHPICFVGAFDESVQTSQEGATMRIKPCLVLAISAVLSLSSVAASSPDYEQEKATVARSVGASQGSFLGVELSEVNSDTARRLNLREERGALIEGVTSGSSAAEAGLQKNDVIVKWEGQSIESARELSRRIRETPAGRSVRLGIVRDGREMEINVKMGERAMPTRPRIARTVTVERAAMGDEAARAREEARTAVVRAREQAREAGALAREQAREAMARARNELRAPGRLGVQLQGMTTQLAEYFGLSKRTGALVVFVYADSAAAKAGLKAGDVILSAGNQNIESPLDLRRALVDKQEGALELRVLRDKQEQTLTVQLEKNSGALLHGGDCVDSIVRAAIGAVGVRIPTIAIAPISVQLPRVSVTPAELRLPEIKIAPLAIPEVKVDLAPMKIEMPNIKVDPVRIVISPKRIVL
jgi:serine protease Do